MRKFQVILSICLSLAPLAVQSQLKSSFPPIGKEQQEQLNKFEMVVTTKEKPGKTWPIVEMRRIVRATPLTSVAIFLALDHQKEYVPNLLKSVPAKHISPTEVHTDYELKLPWPLSNSVYTHASKLSKKGDCYWVSWYMVKSNSADTVEGFSSFCPHPKGTYMEYQSFLEPKSLFAGLFEGSMIKDTSDGIEAIMKYIEKCEKSKKWLVEKYSKYILDALDGKNVYQHLMK